MGRGLMQDPMLEQIIIFLHYRSLHLAVYERLHTCCM